MEQFKKRVTRLYRKRRVQQEDEILPVKHEKLIKLQIIESKKEDGYAASWQRGKTATMKATNVDKSVDTSRYNRQHLKGDVKRIPILYEGVFRAKKKKEVKRVLAEGEAGVGKSTFCTAIAEGWANEKILQKYKVLLHLTLREKEVTSAESLYDLMKFLYAKVDNSLAEDIEDDDGEDVLIILDGWDELAPEDRKRGYIYDLVTGKELSDATLLVTSRPSASALLHKSAHIDRCIEIVGFSEEDVKEYIESEFEEDDNPEKAAKLLAQLSCNPLASSLCGIPLNCAIIVHLWRTSENDNLPVTISGLYRNIILNLILRDIHRKFPEFKKTHPAFTSFDSIPDTLKSSWWNLCELAFHLMERNQVIFTPEELPMVMQNDDFRFGLLQQADSQQKDVAGRVPTVHFLHYTFQEYLAALHLAKQTEDRQMKECQLHCSMEFRRDFDMMWRFFFGVTSDSKSVSAQLSPLSDQVTQGFFKRNYHSRVYKVLCHCAFETQSVKVSTMLLRQLNGRYTAHTAFDFVVILYLLSSAQPFSSASISISNCNLGSKELDELATVLSTKSQSVRDLNLCLNNVTSKILSNLLSRIDFQCLFTLNVRENKLENIGGVLAPFTLDCLTYLDFSHNPIQAPSFEALASAISSDKLHYLQSLIAINALSNESTANSKMLYSLAYCPHLKHLNLSSNNLSAEETQALSSVLPRLTQCKSLGSRKEFRLSLRETKFADRSIEVFAESLKNACSIHLLELNDSNLCSSEALYLASCISSGFLRVKSLELNGCPLGLEGAIAFGQMLSTSHGEISRYAAKKCFANLTTVTPGCSSVTQASQEILKHESVSQQLYCISQSAKSIAELCLNENDFSGKNVKLLAGLLHLCPFLRVLHTKGCSVSSNDLQNLLTSLQQAKESSTSSRMLALQSWDLSENPLDEEAVDILASFLPELFPEIGRIDTLDNISWQLSEQIEIFQSHKSEMSRRNKTWLSAEQVTANLHPGKTEIQGASQSSEERQVCLKVENEFKTKWKTAVSNFVLFFNLQFCKTELNLIVVDSTVLPSVLTILPLLKQAFSTGLRVVRGRDWQSEDKDGGEGFVGTVLEISDQYSNGGRTALVQWDSGGRGSYYCGVEGKFELRVIDSAPTGIKHSDRCSSCFKKPMFGMKWHCSVCRSHVSCTSCYMDQTEQTHQTVSDSQNPLRAFFAQKITHDREHKFVRYDDERHLRVKVSPRAGARRQESRGIFPGAEVVRGPDWIHGDDDGGNGMTGRVLDMKECATDHTEDKQHESQESDSLDSIEYLSSDNDSDNDGKKPVKKGEGVHPPCTNDRLLMVEWTTTGRRTTCRLGHEGKVDVKCVTPSSGGFYYPDHLPLLGYPYPRPILAQTESREEDIFGTFVPELFLERKTMYEVPCMENTSTEELQNTFGPDLVSEPKLAPNVSFEESQEYHEFFGHELMSGSELNSPQKDTSNMGPTGGEASESDEEECLCEAPDVEYSQIQTDFTPAIDITSRGTSATECWELEQIHNKLNGEGIVIAIVDNGINVEHVAFKKKGKIKGLSFVPGEPTSAWRTNSGTHGTMAAFIAGGRSFGIVPCGVAPNATLLICSVGASYSPTAVIKALEALIEMKKQGDDLDIVSMSFGMKYNANNENQHTITGLVSQLKQLNVILVAASGNYGKYQEASLFPAILDEVICVGALNTKGYKSQSNMSLGIDVYAPGEFIPHPSVDTKSGAVHSTGSSCAAPAIAGLLALVVQFSRKYVSTERETEKYRNLVYLKNTLFGVEMKRGDPDLLHPVPFFDSKINEFELEQLKSNEANDSNN